MQLEILKIKNEPFEVRDILREVGLFLICLDKDNYLTLNRNEAFSSISLLFSLEKYDKWFIEILKIFIDKFGK